MLVPACLCVCVFACVTDVCARALVRFPCRLFSPLSTWVERLGASLSPFSSSPGRCPSSASGNMRTCIHVYTKYCPRKSCPRKSCPRAPNVAHARARTHTHTMNQSPFVDVHLKILMLVYVQRERLSCCRRTRTRSRQHDSVQHRQIMTFSTSLDIDNISVKHQSSM